MARKLVQSDSGDIVNLDNALTVKLSRMVNKSGRFERFWSIYTSPNWSPDSVSENENADNFKAVELWIKRNMISGAPPVRDDKGRFLKAAQPTTTDQSTTEDTHGI